MQEEDWDDPVENAVMPRLKATGLTRNGVQMVKDDVFDLTGGDSTHGAP